MPLYEVCLQRIDHILAIRQIFVVKWDEQCIANLVQAKYKRNTCHERTSDVVCPQPLLLELLQLLLHAYCLVSHALRKLILRYGCRFTVIARVLSGVWIALFQDWIHLCNWFCLFIVHKVALMLGVTTEVGSVDQVCFLLLVQIEFNRVANDNGKLGHGR